MATAPIVLGPVTAFAPVVLSTTYNQSIALPAISFTIPSWPGASYIVGIIQLALPADFQLITPVEAALGYVLTVMWVDGERPGAEVKRYKLYTNTLEVLSYPIYAGETIPANAIIEIWCCNYLAPVDDPARNLLVDTLSTTSAESFPASVCTIGALSTLDEMFHTCRA